MAAPAPARLRLYQKCTKTRFIVVTITKPAHNAAMLPVAAHTQAASAAVDDEVPSYGPLCRTVDIGHELNADTIFWPGGERFCLCVTTSGATPADFYAAGTFSCAEHGYVFITLNWFYTCFTLFIYQIKLFLLFALF